MPGKQVTELDALPSFTDTSLLPVHNGAGLKKGLLSQLANYLGTKFSNPNLLTNPDFKINQRGSSTYNNNYTLDRWKIYNSSINASSKTITNSNSGAGNFVQPLENKQGGTFTITVATKSLAGTVKITYRDGTTDKNGITLTNGINTFTFTVNSLTWVGLEIGSGASVQLDYIKLEQGKVATSFIAPDRAEELVKCCRFYQTFQVIYTIYGLSDQHYYQKLPLVTALRANPTVSITDQYNYNVKSKKIEWRTDGGTGWLNLDLVAQGNDQTVCQIICACDAEIY